ncbi:unnamed protein product [Vitrella brassicaformis CCMP3155]|uniref:RAP domain-containing protein n=2 Tax=Vitrella brassicaformis TaxID=1169539 RepID=A0A0G4EB39_VITBC|nr:unnamed protein product [Vitrella brassicaformis CCMP3155]|eukprot:CEL93169.1 unnamed protein product [Vitrella brassicaformis CCMP3155]
MHVLRRPSSSRLCTARTSRSAEILPQCCAARLFSTYVDSTDRKTAVSIMEDPADILQYFIQNSDMDAPTLETTLRCLGRIAIRNGARQMESITADERFHRLLGTIGSRLEEANGRLLAMLATAMAYFRNPGGELLELVHKLGDVVMRRENAFNPRNLSSLALAFSTMGHRDPNLIEFIRVEAVKYMQDFRPNDLHVIMDAYRRWGVYNRELADMLVERMTDEIDRYTSKDVIMTLHVLSQVGLARGFLLRRLATLAFENLGDFDTRQLVTLFYSLSRLRFLSTQNCDDLIDALKIRDLDPKSINLDCMAIAQILFSLETAGYTENPAIIQCLVDAYQHKITEGKATVSLLGKVDMAHALCFYNLKGTQPLLEKTLQDIFAGQVTRNRLLHTKLWEVIGALEVEQKGMRVDIPVQWRAACDETDRLEQDKTETSRVHSEVVLVLDNLKGKYALSVLRNQRAGYYRVDLYDEETKIAIDLDTVNRPVGRLLKHRHMSLQGYRPVSLDYWMWRRCRSEEDQTLFLKQLLTRPLVDAGRLDASALPSADRPQQQQQPAKTAFTDSAFVQSDDERRLTESESEDRMSM